MGDTRWWHDHSVISGGSFFGGFVRILHTSDWHLGVSTGPASRMDEQAWFLDWLLNTLQERAVDALVIAGDVFDTMQPPAEAQKLYFRFLSRVGAAGVRNVVVVGGNHDSASRLDAPRALLETVDVHVVGGVPVAEDRLEQMIAPLRARGSDDIVAVCLTVPYVHEYRLGIRTTDLDRDQTRAAFRAAFSTLYTQLADHAEARFPGLPIIATGHLTMGLGAKRGDYPQEIHQVGTIEGLPTDILDKRIRYTALGHIHRCFPIPESSAWYCGTPIAYALTEMEVPRRVLVTDVDSGDVERVEVPRQRDLVQIVGTPEAVLSGLAALSWTTDLPPLVYAVVETQMAEPGLDRRLHEALAAHDQRSRPVLVERKTRWAGADDDSTEDQTVLGGRSLDELEPRQVFALMCDAQQVVGEDRTQLESAFEAVAGADPQALLDMLADIELPMAALGDAP